MQRLVLAAVCLGAVSAVAGTASAQPTSRRCVTVRDDAGDQVLMYSSVDTAGQGPASLDIRGFRADLTRSRLAVTWNLTALDRPLPGQSWSYVFRFRNGETTYDVDAVMRAGAGTDGPLADSFQVVASDALTDLPVAVPGRFDQRRGTVTITVPASAVGRSTFDGFTIEPTDVYTSEDYGSTLGLFSDELANPLPRLLDTSPRGC